jgi:hypothetical protein
MRNWKASARLFLMAIGLSHAVWPEEVSLDSATVALLAPAHPVFRDEGLGASSQHHGDAEIAADAAISVRQLRGKIKVLMGSGGDIAVVPGSNAKLIVVHTLV